MPAADSPSYLVARFLRTNDYHEVRFTGIFGLVQALTDCVARYQQTLEAFLQEAGLPANAGTTEAGDLTIEKILEEKKTYDISVRFEKIGVGEEEDKWKQPAPSFPTPLSTLPTSSNILNVSVQASPISDEVQGSTQMLLTTTADRRLTILETESGLFDMIRSNTDLHDSPILSCVVTGERYLISSSMSGQVVLYDLLTNDILEERRDHKKYVVKVAVWEDREGTWVATAGWDAKLFLYRIPSHTATEPSNSDHVRLGDPLASLTLSTNPEDVLFISHPDSNTPILVVSRRDSTNLYYYTIPTHEHNSSGSSPATLRLIGSQNLAPHSNAWIAFSPSNLAISPLDASILAVATSAVPHMKLIIVRLLLPPIAPNLSGVVEPATQNAQARGLLAVQDREDAAILSNTNTLAPQTAYSTPQVCWRPDGSGLWVNGDDGVIRGVEASTGKVVATLRNGHELGSKIRTIWAGWVEVNGKREEWIVSGGFDRRLIVWRDKIDA
ncbi:MAG: hypothetical protein M1812_000074 [Candelaria pacifica]|nr:MAG: hypothetical protein M1812_000074 [Candelaria pacifica]